MFGGGWRAGAGMVADPKKEQRPTAVSVIHGGDSMSEMAPVAFSAPSICIALPRQTVSVVGFVQFLGAFGTPDRIYRRIRTTSHYLIMLGRIDFPDDSEVRDVYGIWHRQPAPRGCTTNTPPTHTQNPQDCRTPPEFLGCSAPSHNDWVTEDREASAPRTAHSPSRDALAAPRRQLGPVRPARV